MPRRTGGVSGMGHPHNSIPPNGFGGADYQHLSQNPFFYQCQKYPFYKLKFHMDNCTSCSDLLNGITQVPGSRKFLGTAVQFYIRVVLIYMFRFVCIPKPDKIVVIVVKPLFIWQYLKSDYNMLSKK